MRVFVLGAGASKSYGDSPSGQRMPIARDFFETYDGLDLSANPWVLIGSLVNYVEDFLGNQDAYAYLRSGVDIEELHSQIEADRDRLLHEQGLVAAMTPYKAYNELLFLFAAVLNDIQNGPPSKAHMRLIDGLAEDDVIITFNWDTLLDRTLCERTCWRPDWGYGIAPQTLFDDGWREPRSTGERRGNRLIKLHGSTNWLTAFSLTDGKGKIVPGQDVDPAAFAVFEQASGPYACFKGRYIGDYAPYSYGYYPPNLPFTGRPAPEGRKIVRFTPSWIPSGSAPQDGLTSMPLIIPPVKNKSYDFYGKLFADLWSQAEEALTSADEIMIIGYSFPQTDVQSEKLFKRAFARRKTMPRITILDPNPAPVATRMQAEFGIDENHLCVISQYFSHDTELG